MFKTIDKKLIDAVFVCIIVDIWTNFLNSDFIGLNVEINNPYFEKDILIINMMRMPGSHNSENIKMCVETINKYTFD